MIKYYILCYLNIEVALVLVESGKIISIRINEKNEQYIPYGYTKKTLESWLINRGIPVTRDGIKRNLNGLSPFQFMLLNQGLSLTDHYWLKEVGSSDTWETVNCFINNFKEPYDLDLLHGDIDITEYSDFKPSASLKGDLKKKWVIDNANNRVLIKGNYGKSCLQSISEVFATELHQGQQQFPFVSYHLVKIPTKAGEVTGCSCLNFVDDNTDFISAADVIKKKPRKIRSMTEMFNLFIECCVDEGLDYNYVRSFIDYEIMTDFILTNTDRHLNNFGVLRDIYTLKFKFIAPIFDTGNSMGYTLEYIPVGRNVLKIHEKVGRFEEYETKVLKNVKDKSLINVNILPSLDRLHSLLEVDENLSDSTKDRIERLYEAKVRYFIRYQQGEKIWLL